MPQGSLFHAHHVANLLKALVRRESEGGEMLDSGGWYTCLQILKRGIAKCTFPGYPLSIFMILQRPLPLFRPI